MALLESNAPQRIHEERCACAAEQVRRHDYAIMSYISITHCDLFGSHYHEAQEN